MNDMGYYDECLEHHGILGMKWGVRRFEKAGGGLTAAGKARYKTDSNGNYQKLSKEEQRARKDAVTKWGTQSNQPSSARSSFLAGTYAGLRTSTGKDPKLIGKALDKSNDADEKRWKAAKKARSNMSDEEIKETEKLVKKERAKKALKIGAAVTVTALATYGGYKLYQLNKPSKAFTPEQLNAMGIKTVHPNRIEINRVEPNRINLNTSNGSSSSPNERLQKTLNSMKSMSSNTVDVSKTGDDLVQELLRKNTLRL